MDQLPWDFMNNYAPGERQGYSASRSEQLFASDDYKILFLTGQPDPATGKNTGISVRPYHSIDPADLEEVLQKALKWTAARNHEVTISARESWMILHDGITNVDTYFPLNNLDLDIKGQLLKAPNPWEKYGAADRAPVLSPSQTIPVLRPLRLKRTAKTFDL
ncbi:MAG: hypothetical protein EPN97_10055 [Alphaproteobacteria bacterium]|nr:MAG: hypothetical protein EPN97_10055 [Alphaproteobacteria bacterium]